MEIEKLKSNIKKGDLMSDHIKGIKLIYQTGGTNVPDDPSMPYKLEAIFRPPEFMIVAFIGLYGGSEEIVIRGESREVLEKFIEANNLRTHPRLRQITITGPNGVEDPAAPSANDNITLDEATQAFDTQPVQRLLKDDKDE